MAERPDKLIDTALSEAARLGDARDEPPPDVRELARRLVRRDAWEVPDARRAHRRKSADGLPATLTTDSIPAVIDEIERQLAEARTLPEVATIRDKAEALRLYAKRRGAAVEAQNGCARLVFLAERQIGEELAKHPKAMGGERGGRKAIDGSRAEPSNPTPTLTEIGVGKKQSHEYQQLASAPAAAIDKAVAAANAEQRPVTKADLKRAVADALGFKDPRPTPAERVGLRG